MDLMTAIPINVKKNVVKEKKKNLNCLKKGIQCVSPMDCLSGNCTDNICVGDYMNCSINETKANCGISEGFECKFNEECMSNTCKDGFCIVKDSYSKFTLYVAIFVVALGFGYSISTTNLQLNGTATAKADDSDFDVKFTASVNNTDPTDNLVVTNISYTDTVATFTAVLDSTNDTASATYTITNNSAELRADVRMGTPSITGDTSYFTVTPTFTNTILAAGASTTFTIQVDLTKTPIADKTITIQVPFTADALEAA